MILTTYIWLLITWLDDFYSVLDDCIQQLSGHVLSRWRGTLSVTLTRSTLYFTLSYFYKNQSTECTDKHCDTNFKDVYYSLHFSILDNVSGKTIAFFQKYIINVIINIFQIYACFIFCIFTGKLTKKADFKEILVLRKLHHKFSIPLNYFNSFLHSVWIFYSPCQNEFEIDVSRPKDHEASIGLEKAGCLRNDPSGLP